jgi:hypothetical protein
MADPWTFFASMQVWRSSSLTRRPFGSLLESPWRGDTSGVRFRYVLARIQRPDEEV